MRRVEIEIVGGDPAEAPVRVVNGEERSRDDRCL